MTRPATGLARAQDATLVMLDMQTRPAAALPGEAATRLFRAAARLLRAAERLHVPVIYTEHDPPALGGLDPRVRALLPGSAYGVRKQALCAWRDDVFANAVEIAARRQIVIGGLQAHIGVVQTAIRMADHDFAVFVVEDGVASHDPALEDSALRRLQATPGVSVLGCESLLYEWLDDSDATARDDVLAILQET